MTHLARALRYEKRNNAVRTRALALTAELRGKIASRTTDFEDYHRLCYKAMVCLRHLGIPTNADDIIST